MVNSLLSPSREITMAVGLTWAEIADDLTERIQSKAIQPGAQLKFSELMRHYRTSQSTIQRAMARVGDRGLAEYAQGRGWFVRAP